MAANWMSRLGINTRIIDKRPEKVQAGQADGIQARTLEIWDSFGIVDRIVKEGNPLDGKIRALLSYVP
jgi:2-polyprenyl-6-methoxyphenol hydroxylase-like FAD-dependent oxidoreductase